uniref:DUF4270 family protein n=1 Tax=Fulvivirga sp. TaxID=1931237 RepID=UPI00404B44E4
MNLWDKKLGLFLIALTFFGCEEEIGNISLAPENNLGIFFAETSLAENIGQIWTGAASSSFSGRVMAGQYTDPVFGDITAKAYCDVSIAQANYDKATITTSALKSMSMKVRIVDAAGTYNSSEIQNLELYELVNPIENLENSTSSNKLELGELIGGAKIELYKDSINYVYDGTDTPGSRYDANKVYIYEAKFDIIGRYKDEFLQRFEEAVVRGAAVDTEDTDSVSYFLDQYVKGFAIVGKDDNNAVITFNLNDGNSIINLKYTTLDAESQPVDKEATFLLNYLKSFSNVTPNEKVLWTNSLFNKISTTNEIFKLSSETAYFQSGSNMLIDLDLSGFRNFKDTLSENVIVQRAEVIISDPFGFEPFSQPPSNLGVFLTSLDSIATGNLNILGSATIATETALNMTYNSELKQYSFSIPLYLQALIDNNITYDHLIIDANRVGFTSNNAKYLIPNRDTNLRKLAISKDRVKLRYYYSIPDKN